MPTATLTSSSIYYELSQPDGESQGRVLVIPGTGSDLRRLPSSFGWPGSESLEVLSYEHRGLGRSQPLTAEPPAMTDFARDALELADHVGWPAFSVVGISFGGMVAQHLALLAAERVERLALVVTSGGGALGSSYPVHELYELAVEDRVERWANLLDTRAGEWPELAAALREYMRQDTAGKAPSEGLLAQLEARRGHDVSARAGELAMPCLVLAGRHDGIAPPERAEKLAAAIPDARLAILDGGHGVLLQDPFTWPLIASFLTTGL